MRTGRFRLAALVAMILFLAPLISLTGCGKVWVEITVHQQPQTQLQMIRVSYTNQSEDPHDMVFVGSTPYYVATGTTGEHVFEYTGTNAVQISNTSNGGSDTPTDLVTDNTNLYFVANDSTGNQHVYEYDGSKVFQISSTAGAGGNDSPTNLTWWSGDLYYVADDSASHSHVYEYNGSTTVQISNNNPGGSDVANPGSYGLELVGVGAYLYWINHTYVYAWNGSTTTSVPTGLMALSGLFAGSGKVYFGYLNSSTFLKTLGSFNGSTISSLYSLTSAGNFTNAVPAGSNVYFNFFQLFVYNGSSTTLLSNSASDYDLVASGTDAYFVDDPTTTGDYHVYYTNGSTVTQISNTSSGGNDNPFGLMVSGGDLYFSAHDSNGYGHLYLYNGTNVTQISSTNPSGGDAATVLGISGSNVYFSAADSSGYTHLYLYNGSSVSKLSQPSNNVAGDDNIGTPTIGGNNAYFTTLTSYSIDSENFSGPYYDSLWGQLNNIEREHIFSFDGTHFQQVSNTTNTNGGNDFASYIASNLTPLNGNLYFTAVNALGQENVYMYNGSTASQITATNFQNILYLTPFGTNLCFVGVASSKSHIYCYNGTSVTQISNTSSGGSDHPQNLTVSGSNLYFVGANSTGDEHIYVYNGSTVTQISNTSSGGNDYPGDLTLSGSGFYFGAEDSGGYSHLYFYNGTSVLQVSSTSGPGNSDLNQSGGFILGYANSYYSLFTPTSSGIYFSAHNSSGDDHIYFYNGTTVAQVSNTSGGGNDGPSNLTLNGSTLYFTANDSGGTQHLYYYNGSTVKQITNASTDSPSALDFDGPNLFFINNDANSNQHLYKYDGTSVSQISNTSGGGNDSPILEAVINSIVYFQANDASGKPHLYSYNGSTVTQMSTLAPSGEVVDSLFTLNSKIYAVLTVNNNIALYEYK